MSTTAIQSIISFPHWYNNPSDFHEAVIKTSLETQKLRQSKSYTSLKGSFALGYAPLIGSPLDIRFLIMMIQLLFREGYDRLCIIQCDYTLTYLDWIQYESDDIVSPLATTRNETTLSSRFGSSSKASFDENTQYAITIAQLLVDLQSVICFKVGTTNPLEATKGKHTKKITTQFIALDTMLTEIVNDRRYAILLIGDAHLDKNNKYGSSIVFDSIATTLDRTVKSIGCKSPVGPLSFIVA